MLRNDAVTGKRQFPTGLALFLCLFVMACSGGEDPPPKQVLPGEPRCQVDISRLEQRQVEKVVDGDTLHLTGGDKVRLIGVNTPEFGRDGRPDEPLAGEAQRALAEMLGPGRRVWLQDGRQPRDRYGRRLAYAFDSAGDSLSGQLIARGLGFHVAISPNHRHASCLQALESSPRRQKLGIWGKPAFAVLSVARLQRDQGGFVRVRDRVTRVSFKQNGWWVQLGGKLGVQIDGEAQALFSRGELQSLDGREVEVRGWLVPMKGDWWLMNLGHPSMLQVGGGPG